MATDQPTEIQKATSDRRSLRVLRHRRSEKQLENLNLDRTQDQLDMKKGPSPAASRASSSPKAKLSERETQPTGARWESVSYALSVVRP